MKIIIWYNVDFHFTLDGRKLFKDFYFMWTVFTSVLIILVLSLSVSLTLDTRLMKITLTRTFLKKFEKIMSYTYNITREVLSESCDMEGPVVFSHVVV